ncbi:phage tail protein [Vibrio cholerae]|uniref:phage minor tail U family protein n=1 Tax=Vibrio cholerae TaxID=666 RepID=UPI00208BD698|nr:phage tail protein [Vibrio cholerae]GHZ95912.1 phage minor tail U family protein [Vibrio cholerae]HDZ9131754.1 phage tail protein [Vibrio cholerae]HEJ2467379.1 phage tail protein [Vibrio cholerae]
MEINKKIRKQVITDLETHLVDINGNPLILSYLSGRGEPVLASDDGEISALEVPAISVYINEGGTTGQDFEKEEWKATLTVEIMDLATNQLDDDLDDLGEKVLSVIHRNYTANGLLTLCNRAGFSYIREDGAPWGSLALTFIVELETE